MYDNSISQASSRSAPTQFPHMAFAENMVSNISEMPLDQQNEILVFILKAIREMRRNEMSALARSGDEITERRATITHMEESLHKQMESLRISDV